LRFIEIFKPLRGYVLEISPPGRKIPFNEKLFWTGMALILYFVMAETPLFGIGSGGADPFGALRVIFASNRGTLMELGIGPIVTAGLILQILKGSKMVDINMNNPEDRALFTTASKIFSLILILFEALAFIIGGVYGDISNQAQLIILVQLLAAGIIIMLLDELLQKGWGFGSGISLFIAAGVAQTIWWNALAPLGPLSDGKYLGSIIAFVQTLGERGSIIQAIYRTEGLPDMIGLGTTIAIFLIVIYLNGLRVEIPVSYAKYRGYRSKFPIKLLYSSNIPVIFASALFGNIFFITQILWTRYNPASTNQWLNLLGIFETEGNQYVPKGGLVYYVISPRSLSAVMEDPIRAVVFTGLMVLTCVFFAITWVEVGGMDARSVSKQLLDSGMQIEGFRRAYTPIQTLLSRYIPTVTIIGGIILGLIASFSDFLGVFGSGVGILLLVGILEQYYQILARERIADMYPALGGLLGR
jgi:preprotein translocase SecY subunit